MNQLLYTLSLYGITGTSANLYLALMGVLIVVGFFIIIKVSLAVIRWYLQKDLVRDQVVLSVALPKFNSDDKDGTSNPKTHQELVEKISSAEALMNSIAGVPRQKGIKVSLFGRLDYYSFEIVLRDGLIYFYTAVPRVNVQYMKEQITAQFPTAVVEEEDDYNIFQPQGVIDGMEIKFAKEYIYPIKTYKDIETDSLSAITNALSKLPDGTGVAVQFLVRSANDRWRKWGQKAASKAHQGKKLKSAVKEAKGGIQITRPILDFLGSFGANKNAEKKEYKLTEMESSAVKKIEEKTSKSGLETNIRIVVSAANSATTQMALENVVNSFSQFNIYEYGNAFKKGKIKVNKLIHRFIFREFNEANVMILNSEEAASVFHFPLPHIETPNIAWLKSRRVGAPNEIPKDGLILGYNYYRGVKTPIMIQAPDRQRHMYVIGMTGTGKSKFLVYQCIQDIKAGRGVCYIDPHGDDVDQIMANIPPERMDDVIVFDPADFERPIGMNMLEFQTPEQKIFVVNEMFAIFDKLYDLKATGGPQFEIYMKNAMLLLMEDTDEPPATLVEVSKVLADEDYRAYKLSKCKTQVIKDFWEKEAQKAGGEASLANMVPYLTSKMAPFIVNDLMRPIISQQKSAFNFREAMDGQKIIIVKLSKGKLGDINANLLGMILVGKILGAALSRADMALEDRKDFYLYIDEFQNFLTDSINVILSEARKYRLSLIIAHQFVGQLIQTGNNTKIKDAIFGNVGTKVCFRIGVDDAEALAKEFAPVFNQYDLLNLPAYNCNIKLMVKNTNVRPFNMQMAHIDDWDRSDPAVKAKVTEISRQKYGRDRQEVEDSLNERLRKVYKVEGATPNLEDISLEDLFK